MWQGHLTIFLCQGGQDGGPEHLNPVNPKSGQHQFSSNNNYQIHKHEKNLPMTISDFVTNSYGESWDSS